MTTTRDWIIHAFAADAMDRGVKQGGGGFAQVKRFSQAMTRRLETAVAEERVFPRPAPPESLTVEKLWDAISPYLLEAADRDRLEDYVIAVGDHVFPAAWFSMEALERACEGIDFKTYKVDDGYALRATLRFPSFEPSAGTITEDESENADEPDDDSDT